MIDNLIEKKMQNQEALRNESGPYLDLRKDSDYSSLEEFTNDLAEIQDDMTTLISYIGSLGGISARSRLERMRYKLASYLDPICCVCSESPARYINDAWYCVKCVEKDGD
jgi:hypothetical protein